MMVGKISHQTGKRIRKVNMRIVPPDETRRYYRVAFKTATGWRFVPKGCFECGERATIFAFERYLCLTHAVEAQMIINFEEVTPSPEDMERRKKGWKLPYVYDLSQLVRNAVDQAEELENANNGNAVAVDGKTKKRV